MKRVVQRYIHNIKFQRRAEHVKDGAYSIVSYCILWLLTLFDIQTHTLCKLHTEIDNQRYISKHLTHY